MGNILLTYLVSKRVKISTFLETRKFGKQNIFELIKEEHVLINKHVVKGKNEFVNIGDVVSVILNNESNEIKESDLPLDIRYEDKYILIVNKPYNLDVEPSRFTETNNLSSRITSYFKKHNIQSKIHLVNRLDKLTRGLVLVAKNRYIKSLFQNIKILKVYEALVEGHLTPKQGVIINKIARDKEGGPKRVVTETGKPCMTSYKVLKEYENSSLVEVTLFTGRTHQIRVTFNSLGHSLVNDPLYSNKEINGEMSLTAKYIKFVHPITGEVVEISL